MPDPADRKSLKPGIKMLVEYGPLVLFFIINARFGIMHGTAALVAATVVALGYAWAVTKRSRKFRLWLRRGGAVRGVDAGLQ